MRKQLHFPIPPKNACISALHQDSVIGKCETSAKDCRHAVKCEKWGAQRFCVANVMLFQSVVWPMWVRQMGHAPSFAHHMSFACTPEAFLQGHPAGWRPAQNSQFHFKRVPALFHTKQNSIKRFLSDAKFWVLFFTLADWCQFFSSSVASAVWHSPIHAHAPTPGPFFNGSKTKMHVMLFSRCMPHQLNWPWQNIIAAVQSSEFNSSCRLS